MNTEELINRLERSSVDYIQDYENMLDEKTCDYFIKRWKDFDKDGITEKGRHNDLSEDGKIITEADESKKLSKDIFLSSNSKVEGVFNMHDNDKDKEMFQNLSHAINKAVYMYSLHAGLETKQFMGISQGFFSKLFKDEKKLPNINMNLAVEGVCLRKYKKNKGGYYSPHYDAHSNLYRLLAIIVYLNDVKFGGETSFPVLKRAIRPKKGNIVVFPSNFNYVHYGRIATSDKYVVVSHILRIPENQNKEKE
tara:strand:+ start:3520 stop:4272 length:753 start_codon:yes stop_codon:yes gene_type:complete